MRKSFVSALSAAALAVGLVVQAGATELTPSLAGAMKTLLAARVLTVTSAASATSGVVIIDGDTIALGKERIRILSIDTPETFRSRCENELVLGLRAKERLRELLSSGEIRIERNGQDRYRRTLATVFAGGANVGETLLREGFALPYQPGGKAKLERLKVWCGPDAVLE